MKEENVRRFEVPKNVWQKFDPKWIDECKSTCKQEIDSWRTKVDKYKSNVESAYENSVRFYWGVKDAIPDWFDRFGNSDWWDIEVEDMIPLGVAFPGSTPTFTELPTLDDVWDSVSISLDFFRIQLDSAEAKAVQLAKKLE